VTTYNQKDAELAQRLFRQEYLPPEFLGYMNDYLAMNQAPIPLSNIMGVSAAMLPIGMPCPWLTTTIPTGFVKLDGAAVSRTTYVLLFELWGTAFGVGDGSTTFNMPDMAGRMFVGLGSHADVDTIGDNDGTTLASRRPKHSHTVTGGGHTHSITDPGHTHSNTAHSHTAPRATVAGGAADVFLPGNTASGTLSTNTSTITIATASTGITGTNSTDATPTVGLSTAPVDGPAYFAGYWITRYLIHATPQPVTELNQPLV
jgi:microcystin-dependent protein